MKKLLTLYLTLSTFILFAQNETIDSLQQALKNYDAKKLELHKNLLPEESDTSKVKTLNNLSWEFWMVSDYAAAKKYADDAMAIAKQIEFKYGIGRSYSIIGAIYARQGDNPEALKNLFVSLKIFKETGYKNGIASVYNNIGNIYFQQGNYPEALNNYYSNLKISEETGNKNGIANSYSNIGNIYCEQNNYPESLKKYFASLKIYKEVQDKNGIANAYNNIGNIYYNQGNYPEALNNHFATLRVKEETGDKHGIAYSYYNIGNVYYYLGNYTEALKHYYLSLKIRQEIGDKHGISITSIGIGATKLKMQAAKEGKDWLIKGLQLAKEVEALSIIKDGYEYMAIADSALGNFKGAHENHKLYILYRDSINNEEATEKSLQTKMQYEFDKKEAETKVLTDAELNKQKLVRNGFMGSFAVVLLFAGVFFRQRNKIKKEKHRAETALDELQDAQQKLVEKEKLAAIGTLAQRMAHEIQNPLNFVNNFSDLSEELTVELANAKTEAERQEIISAMKENMSRINHHGKRADGIIKNLQRHLNEGKGLDLFEK